MKTDAQADLSLCWAHIPFCRFVMHWLIYHKVHLCFEGLHIVVITLYLLPYQKVKGIFGPFI